jgi:hypothetical protein
LQSRSSRREVRQVTTELTSSITPCSLTDSFGVTYCFCLQERRLGVLSLLPSRRWFQVLYSCHGHSRVHRKFCWTSVAFSVHRKAATYTQNSTNTKYTHTDIHDSSGIRNYDPSVRASEDSSCLRLHGSCDRQRSTDYVTSNARRLSSCPFALP